MANSYGLYIVSFDAAPPILTGISGSQIVSELGGFVDTDSADVEIDDHSARIRLATNLTEQQILLICDEVKKLLEKTGDGRVLYKLETIDL